MGHGISIPHAYCSGTGEPVCVVGRLARGLEMRTFDDVPVRLVFLLISPAGKAENHLESLGRLARTASNPQLIESLLQVESEQEGLHLLHDYQTVMGFLEETTVRQVPSSR